MYVLSSMRETSPTLEHQTMIKIRNELDTRWPDDNERKTIN